MRGNEENMEQPMISQMPQRQEVERWIKEKLPDIEKDLVRICKIRSVAEVTGAKELPYGTGCRQVLQEMLFMGEENGFEVRNYDNYVGCISYGSTTDEYQADAVGIWAHLDVVDEGDTAEWQYEPYKPQVKQGYFIARGCQDNKSSAIMALYVMKYLKEHQIELKHGLQLYVGTCEEQGMYDLDYYTSHYPSPALSLVPDSGFPVCFGERGIFNGELISNRAISDDILELSCNGSRALIPDTATIILRWTEERQKLLDDLSEEYEVNRIEDTIRITAKGVASHTANPRAGKNALLLLTKVLCQTKVLKESDRVLFELLHVINSDYSGKALDIDCEDEMSGPATVTAANAYIKDGRLAIQFFSRLPVSSNEIPFREKAAAAAERWGFQLEVIKLSKSNYFDPKHPAVSVLTDTYNKVMGLETKPFVMSGGTYASKLPRAFAFGTGGLPIQRRPEGLFLPGHGDYHQPDEAIAMERIEKAILVYIYSILELDKLEKIV